MEPNFMWGTSLKGLLTCLFTQKQMFKHLLKYCEIFSPTEPLVLAA